MTSSFMPEPLLELFLFESGQLLEQLEQRMIEGEKSGFFSPGVIDEMMRAMHTIKGSAAMMGFQHIAALSHSLEDLFIWLKGQTPNAEESSELADIVLEGCDFIKLELYKIKQGDVADGEADKPVFRVKALLDRLKQGDRRMEEEKKPDEYRISVHFDDGCQMENVRAFALINRLQEAAESLVYDPPDIQENPDSAEVIRKQGFTLWMRTTRSREELNAFFEQTAFVRQLAVEALPREQWPSSDEPRSLEIRQPASVRDSMISVQVDKLDKLMDLVGELVISESMVTRNPELAGLSLNHFTKAARQLRKITGEIQDMVMSIRMVPLTTSFQKLQRIVRDMCKQTGKEIRLRMIGEDTEVDKNIIEHISDPLMHLIRNAADHGIEEPELRSALGKERRGTITLEAQNVGNEVLVTIKDDGRGLDKEAILERAAQKGLLPQKAHEMTDEEIYALIFLPGFSTREVATAFSGRGVGMDVVVRNLEAVGGTVHIASQPREGTAFTLRIPLTLAIIDGMNIRVGQSRFTLPMNAIRESLRAKEANVIFEPDGTEMLMIRGSCYPVRRLHRRYKVEKAVESISGGIIVMVEYDRRMVCVLADELLGEQQVVVKAMPEYIRMTSDIKGISGCTLLGDGSISLILDVAGLVLNEIYPH